ncbi:MULTISPECIES: response regulator [Clostridium]|uniref:Stage 0 sporulation protein A homolog n=1 Tax=Clostridium aquiflavi TaxID=3073603 RepID=A0ABU1EG49_9CLOT|nr:MULTISPECIES: response regulator [unclassified Clostridium]MDR5587366.1 response regulator [Clostridium sp. 5N-1]NFG60882.1 response regulator [Clostridium botulinum]NFQ08316.1 response regulator [Clostridium botulinum]
MKKVLIIDDSSYMRMFLKKIIQKGGSYTIFEASTKDDAIEMFKTEKPDIVTLDLNISAVMREGIDTLIDIMSIDPEAVVIIVSASGYENFKDECIELGAKSYIKKPFDTETILKTLEEYK